MSASRSGAELLAAAPGRAERTRYMDELAERGLSDARTAIVGLLADTWRWATARGRLPGGRKGRRPGLRLVPALVKPLSALDGALRRTPGARGARARAAEAAHVVAGRLDTLGAVETAWGFHAAAVALAPSDPVYATAAGQSERRRRRYPAAAQWLAHAARQADGARRPLDATAALIALAGTVGDQEHHAYAARLLAFAGRYARHRKAHSGEGDALLALGLLRHGLGYTAEAHGYFTDAVLAYGTDHQRRVRAGLEIGRCWLDQAEFVAALKLHVALLPHVSEPRNAMRGAARLVRAAAATGCETLMEEWWGSTFGWVGLQPKGADTAAALVDLARAAGICGLCVRAKIAAAAGLALAREAGDPAVTDAAAQIMAILALPDAPIERAMEVFPDLGKMEPQGDPADNIRGETLCMPAALEPLFNAITCGLPRVAGSELPLPRR